jgi:hypothetical protein
MDDALTSEINEIYLLDGWSYVDADVAAQLEEEGCVRVLDSVYARKQHGEWRVLLTSRGRLQATAVMDCGGSHSCQECGGTGYGDGMDCPVCGGTGECPCFYSGVHTREVG